jgi:hypothetical protein
MEARRSSLVRCGLEQLAIWISCSGKIGLYITHASKTVHTLDLAGQCPCSVVSVATGTTSPWTAESRRLWRISERSSCRPLQSCRTAAFYKIEDSRTEGIFQRIPLRVTCSKSTTALICESVSITDYAWSDCTITWTHGSLKPNSTTSITPAKQDTLSSRRLIAACRCICFSERNCKYYRYNKTF